MLEAGEEEVLLCSFDQPRLTDTGIDMGAPGCKGLLTLWQLAAYEELKELNLKERMVSSNTVYNDSDWDEDSKRQVFSIKNPMFGYLVDTAQQYGLNPSTDPYDYPIIGDSVVRDEILTESAGDDVMGLGQKYNLLKLVDLQRQNDSIVKEEKYLLSPTLGILCEQAILRTVDARAATGTHGKAYETHLLVDAYKVRLFSPCSKAQESQDGTNPAIGKARALFERSEPFDDGWIQFEQVGRTVRFVSRMRKHLPHTSNGQVKPICYLPSNLGGLGILPKFGDYTKAIESLSEDHVFLIELVLNRTTDGGTYRVLASMSKDRHARGIKIEQDVIDDLLNNLEEQLSFPPKGVNDCFDIYDVEMPSGYGGFVAKRNKLHSLGFVSRFDIRRAYTRAWQQTKILSQTNNSESWKIETWTKRLEVFERSVTRYANIQRMINGYEESYKVDRVSLIARMNLLTAKQLSGLTWEEEKFWHPQTKATNSDDGEVYPIIDIVNAIVRLELPAINDGRWHHTSLSESGFAESEPEDYD
jgi:hypothetical protein